MAPGLGLGTRIAHHDGADPRVGPPTMQPSMIQPSMMQSPVSASSSSPSTMQIGPIAAVVAFAVAKGITLEQIAEATGLTLAELVQPEARIPDAVGHTVWHLLVDRFAGEAVGLQMAKTAPLSFFGSLSQIATYAESLRSTIEAAVRYCPILSAGLRMQLHPGPRTTTLTMRHALGEHDYLRAPSEAVFGLWARQLRALTDDPGVLVRVEFTHAPSAPLAQYREILQTEVRFGQPDNALVFDNRALDRPRRRSDGHAFGRLAGHLEAQRERLVGDRTSSALSRIREAIADNARRGEYGAEPLAKRLGMSLRTLERHVRAQGTSVRRLLDEARQAHARRLLGNPRLGIDEVASRVGYSAESAFRRAFKRWSGMSPTQFRRGALGQAASSVA